MLRYEVKSHRSLDRMSDEELLLELLELRGVQSPQDLLAIDRGQGKCLYDAMSFDNMKDGLELFRGHLDAGNAIHLLMDVDVDGCTSSAIMYLWLKHYYPDIKVTFDCNEGKKHGTTRDIMERIPEDAMLFITPDSSSSDTEEHIELWEQGIDILVLDHHEFDKEVRTPAVIINCMDGNYPNTSLTGATVVYKFLSEYESNFKLPKESGYISKLLPLAALGTIADLADVRELETRYLCLEGLKNFADGNLFLQAVMEEQEYSMKGIANFVTVGWYVAPLMNAIFREGTLEDRYDLFKAICNFEEERIYTPQRKTKDNPNKEPVVESLQKNVIRRAKSIKSHQDNEVKKEVKELTKMIETECPLETNPVIILDVTDKVGIGHSGLIANKLASTYMRPVLLINGMGGSARNYSKFPIDDLNTWITSSGLVEGHGHSNAFGLNFVEEPDIEQLKEWTKEQLDGKDTSPVWHVDFEFNIAKLKEKHILKVGQFAGNFGGKNMDEPLFAVTGIVLETADVQRLGQSGTMMKFTSVNGDQKIDFVRPFTSQDKYKEFVCEDTKASRGINTDGGTGNKKIEATIIGRFKINEFMGKQFPQIEIVEFDTKPVTGRSRRRGF